MTRLIDADDMVKSLMDMTFYDDEGYTIHDYEERLAIVKSFVDSVPTVEAEPVRHGKWNDIDSQMYTWKVRCDQCGHERSMMSTQGRYPKYCENCGAKMVEL